MDGVFFVEDRPTLCPVGLRGADTCKAVDHRCCRGLSFRVSNSGVGAGPYPCRRQGGNAPTQGKTTFSFPNRAAEGPVMEVVAKISNQLAVLQQQALGSIGTLGPCSKLRPGPLPGENSYECRL